VPALGDYDDGEIGGMMIGMGKPKYSEKTCPNVALFTTKPTCCPDANPGRHGGKPAPDRLSYGTAYFRCTYHNIDHEFLLGFCFQEVSPLNFEDQSYNETSRGQ
jgi:hypothetical protein